MKLLDMKFVIIDNANNSPIIAMNIINGVCVKIFHGIDKHVSTLDYDTFIKFKNCLEKDNFFNIDFNMYYIENEELMEFTDLQELI